MYLIDTNVISEVRKGRKANRGVIDFWKAVDPDSVYISVLTIGELRSGVEKIMRRGDVSQGKMLERWLALLIEQYKDRIISFDEDCAQVWGKLMALQNQHPIDKQIAAIALIHDFRIVTRNLKDFEGTGVEIINPFIE